MSKTNIRTFSLAAWLGLVALVGAAGVLAGARPNPSTIAFLMVTCVVPLMVMMMVWRGAPPTIAEVLHTAEGRAHRERSR